MTIIFHKRDIVVRLPTISLVLHELNQEQMPNAAWIEVEKSVHIPFVPLEVPGMRPIVQCTLKSHLH